MLELNEIKKDYPAGSDVVHALRGVSVQFRSCEFVSILGPSGCGKTTLLNIIGGLDKYSSGDLLINGISTKEYKDRDWDAYRNHSVGFVFQSYNLIPHQTVLQNVEIALTLSGVSRKERRARAKKALEDVGLGNQLSKRPAEMSGGQMQRVAIARAIVNNPDIILADEPTGALDTETSIQVMDILKEISKDRLVVMVTHNPDLAEKYSTRIIRMLDGQITSDSMPLLESEVAKEKEKEITVKQKGKEKKPSMSFFTSFGLSLKNLFTKKGRTALTSFAGSIGIIGIALIYAVSQGTTNYVDQVQEETLSSYPITLEETVVDLSSLLQSVMNLNGSSSNHDKDAVYEKTVISNLLNSLNNMDESENDLASFKAYLEEKIASGELDEEYKDAINGVKYTYNLALEVLTRNADGSVIESDTTKLMRELLSSYIASSGTTNPSYSTVMGPSMYGGSGIWSEMLDGMDGNPINGLIPNQYDLIYGTWPNSYDEVVLVVDENNELSEITLYALGLLPKADVEAIMEAYLYGTDISTSNKHWSYEEICAQTYKVILSANKYSYDTTSKSYTDLTKTDAGMEYLYSSGIDLRVTGIIRAKESAISHMLSGTICYTRLLTEHIVHQAESNALVQAQLQNPTIDIFTGLPFENDALTKEQKADWINSYVTLLSTQQKAKLYESIASTPSETYLNTMVETQAAGKTRTEMENQLVTVFLAQSAGAVDEATIRGYLEEMDDETVTRYYKTSLKAIVAAQYANAMKTTLATMTDEQKAAQLDANLQTASIDDKADYYDNNIEFSDSTLKKNLKKLGYVDLDSPSTISIYASSFENKDRVEDLIAEYNRGVNDSQKITYTDYVGLMMSSITTIINAITYVLIAFVAISLIVSSIMIGVITLISVQERTKEIGILRAIGASKSNVSSMFNAETLIIGFSSGFLGVLITYLLCIPINLILHKLTDISTLSATLPIVTALILITISMLLTLIAGIIPSRSAAKKDPVVALRTE